MTDDNYQIPTFPLEGMVSSRGSKDLFGGSAAPVYFGASDVLRVEIPMPPAPCRRCGRDLRGQKFVPVDPHASTRADGSACEAYYLACAPGEGCAL